MSRSVGDAILISELSLALLKAKARTLGYAGEPIQRAVLDPRGIWIEMTWIPND